MFKDYPLKEPLLEALAKKGFEIPTPIQAAALPLALEGRDVLGQARTGTGKMLAFALPSANRLEADKTKGRAPRALIITPTRELALQVAGELEWVAPQLTTVTIYGGIGYGSQATALRRGTDVVVATPGRAIDYFNQGVLTLSEVQVVVLDEADEMLSMGFEEDMETLLGATPKERQTLLFSATLPAWAKRLAAQHLQDPVVLNMVKDEAVSYQEIAIDAPLRQRPVLLSDVIHAYASTRAIVFTRTKAEVDEIAQSLATAGHGAEAVHGDLNQIQRERVLERFRSGQATVLVATDVAARGLDIPEVDLVVHYRMPERADIYQHRSGRTGRAGRGGKVVLLYSGRERHELAGLERAVARRFQYASAPRPEEIRSAKLTALLGRLENQSAEDRAVWRAVAAGWVSEGEVDSIAGLLALLLGGAPEERSLLTGEEGWRTMRLAGRNLVVPQVVRLLKEAGAGDVGRIQLAPDAAYLDLRPAEVSELEPAALAGVKLSLASTVPAPERKPERGRGPRKPRGGGRPYRGSGYGR
ncbi:DEAD/DEAH box helicase [soil metagenome]